MVRSRFLFAAFPFLLVVCNVRFVRRVARDLAGRWSRNLWARSGQAVFAPMILFETEVRVSQSRPICS